MNVIINAYAISPTMGSEPGMGWHWVTNLAKFCNLFVITEGEWKEEIVNAVANHPFKRNMHFFYIPVSDRVRRMCWNQGDWRFYYYYHKWQKRALEMARQICLENRIDIIHQLNMVGFREPGLLWKIKGYKYVWGPVGGLEMMPIAYLKSSGFKALFFNILKNVINRLQYKFQPNVHFALKNADALVAATRGCQQALQRYYKGNVEQINETGCQTSQILYEKSINDSKLDIFWCGKFDFRKRLDLAIRVIGELKNLNVRLHIAGSGKGAVYKRLVSDLGIEDKIIWYGQVDHDAINMLMQQSDLFMFTSIMEATSTVVMEALQNSLPVICFDICGFGTVINETVGAKIPLTNASQSVKDFAAIIRGWYHDRERLAQLAINCKERVKLFTWEQESKQMFNIYKKLLN